MAADILQIPFAWARPAVYVLSKGYCRIFRL